MVKDITKWHYDHRENQIAINTRFDDGKPEGNLLCYWNGKRWVIERQRRNVKESS